MNRNWNKDWRKSIIVMSGGFDPIHKGHLRMFREASNLGHQVIVGLNSDEWLTRKKGKPFMEFYERKEILEGIKYISNVVKFDLSGISIEANSLSIIDIDTRSVEKGEEEHLSFGPCLYRVLNSTSIDTDKCINSNNTYKLRVSSGRPYTLSEIKLIIKVISC